MWTELAMNYGLFILKMITFFLIITGTIITLVAIKQQKKSHLRGELIITNLSEEFEKNVKNLETFYLSKSELKLADKHKKQQEKLNAKLKKDKQKNDGDLTIKRKPHLFLLNFKGDISASETTALREEISAIIAVAKPDDEVLLCLESPGGVVHGYGLAASQLARLKQHHIKLVIAVDKVAASGGYMMACVADKIVAAPFAIIGSVGVVAQIPNIHRLLKKHDVDIDIMTAGEYKRTVTLLGENTEKGKQKFQQELEETHKLFKQFVTQHRPEIDIEQVATGEHWFGQQALKLNLIDEITTSDDLISQAIKNKLVLSVKYSIKKSLVQKFGQQIESYLHNTLLNLLKRNDNLFL